jgi:hypothetical protein
MPTPLFSTYRHGENRITGSMLAVLERIDTALVVRLLSAFAGEESLAFVKFVNQFVGKPGSVPDASISASFRYLFEVKTQVDAVRTDQLKGHLANLTGDTSTERLFVITPDGIQPAAVAEISDPKVIWLNFVAVSQAIDALLADSVEQISERDQFLLREFQRMLADDGLTSTADVVIVAARLAYDEYQKFSAYLCQPGRTFRQGVTHMGFYYAGSIQRELPRIRARRDDVPITPEALAQLQSGGYADRAVARVVELLLADQSARAGDVEQILVLSSPTKPETVVLEAPILNVQHGRGGQPTAWTMGQRYTTLVALQRNPATTNELELGGG